MMRRRSAKVIKVMDTESSGYEIGEITRENETNLTGRDDEM